MQTTGTLPRTRSSRLGSAVADEPLALVLRVVAVVGLSVDVWVHATLESQYAGLGDTITQGRLFGAEAVVAGVVALWLLLTGSRFAWAAAFLVGASALGAVLLYRYVDVGSLGPLPNMYEPIWFFRKTLSAYAEAAVVAASLLRFGLMLRERQASGERVP